MVHDPKWEKMTSLLFASRDIIYLYSFFLGKMLCYLHPVTYNNNKNGRKNNISQQHGYKLGYCIPRLNCFFLRIDIFVPIIS